jgi:hypothetical protein
MIAQLKQKLNESSQSELLQKRQFESEIQLLKAKIKKSETDHIGETDKIHLEFSLLKNEKNSILKELEMYKSSRTDLAQMRSEVEKLSHESAGKSRQISELKQTIKKTVESQREDRNVRKGNR